MSTALVFAWLLSLLGFQGDFELIGLEPGDSSEMKLPPPPDDPYDATDSVQRSGPPERISNGF
jgi:hypothetical protein